MSSRLLPSMLLSLVAHLALFNFLFWMVSPYWGASPQHSMSSILTVKVVSLKSDTPRVIEEGRLEKTQPMKPKSMQVEKMSDVPIDKPRSRSRSRSIGQKESTRDTAVIPPAPSKSGREISSWQAGIPGPDGDISVSRRVASTSWLTPSKKEQEKRYLADLHAAIAGKKFYPEQARREGREGRVVVGITIRRDGEITNVAVVEPSGSRLLDRAASKAVRQLGRFRPFSNQIVGSALTTQIAFAYLLEN